MPIIWPGIGTDPAGGGTGAWDPVTGMFTGTDAAGNPVSQPGGGGGGPLGGGLGGAIGLAGADAGGSSIDQQIAELEAQIATAMEGGGAAGPDNSAFFRSPGYEFRLQEGIDALDKSASARGKLGSGGLQRELVNYGQGLATAEFNSYANRLASMAGLGQTATGGTSNLGSNTAGQVGRQSASLGETVMAGGQAGAEGIIGSNNAMITGIQNAAGAFGIGSGGNNAMFGVATNPGRAPATTSGYNWF